MMRQRQTRQRKPLFRVTATHDGGQRYTTRFHARGLLDASRKALKMSPNATHFDIRRIR